MDLSDSESDDTGSSAALLNVDQAAVVAAPAALPPLAEILDDVEHFEMLCQRRRVW